ncbi:MAG TPA: Asp-tRNA(Asn)/Glu-tRNA(Gln) amidotransferase subunit GatC [Candidatus Handelsmanbacteria bacterium]|nr:Asp-tRNA(Asn)/Glu-tRNA(Gln) amidotransferase subunit GatC [Candidatus Handelsmanbacteria bacterium]
MAVTTEDVKRVAALARLDLSPDEQVQLTDELGRILQYMDKLNELDTDGVEPSAHAIAVSGTFRADEAEIFSGVADLLAQAPDRRDRYYRVPRVID